MIGGEAEFRGDLLVKEGEIVSIAPEIGEEAETVVEGSGLLVVPALVDLHCHLREPGLEHKETIATGCRSAAAGGFGQVCCMPNTRPAIDCEEVVQHILRAAESRGAGVRVHPIGAATLENANREPADYAMLKKAGCVAVSDDGAPIQDHALMREALEQAAETGIPFVAHCEFREPGEEMDPDLPAHREWKSVERNLALAIETGAHLHIAHLSTAASLRAFRDARKDTDRVSTEVCPHHLILTRADRIRIGPNAKVSPPLREETDTRVLAEALALREIPDMVIATDHAPHAANEKQRGMLLAPPGMIGFETCFPLAYTHLLDGGHLELPELLALLTAAPARIFGLPAPRLAQGEPARLAVFERGRFIIDETWIRSKSKNTPFLGFEVGLRHRATVLGEDVLVRDWEMAEA